MFLRGILCASLAALSWPALAQSQSEASTPAPSCTVFDASLPDAFTGWRTKTNLQTADGRRSLQGTGIVPGVTYDLALLPTARGTGAAGMIVAQLTELAREKGFATMSLVAVNGSLGFWRKQGFMPIDAPELAEKLASYEDAARFMVKSLT